MKSKYSITDEDHIYYDIMTKSDSTLNSFVNWISTISTKYEVGGDFVKIGDSTIKFQLNREGVASFSNSNQSFDFWWNFKSDNSVVKEKIKNLLGL